jgi:hypothetical protein
MTNLIKVKDYVGLHRDAETGAVVNSCAEDFNKYKKKRDSMLAQQKRLDTVEKDVGEIKSLLKELVSKL